MTTKQHIIFNPRFPLGYVAATPGAVEILESEGLEAAEFLNRHASCDWGDICDEDKRSNEAALKYGSRLLSSYSLPAGAKLWIITEADRSVTTLLLPKEY